MRHRLFLDRLFLVGVLNAVAVCVALLYVHTFSCFFVRDLGWLTKFSDISFLNVALRGRFRWPYDLILEDDGTLTDQNESMIIMAPDGMNNASSSCSPAPYFNNAIECPASFGRWIRLGLNETTSRLTPYPLSISNQYNHSTSVAWYPQELTHSTGYMMVLRANDTYEIGGNHTFVSGRIS